MLYASLTTGNNEKNNRRILEKDFPKIFIIDARSRKMMRFGASTEFGGCVLPEFF